MQAFASNNNNNKYVESNSNSIFSFYFCGNKEDINVGAMRLFLGAPPPFSVFAEAVDMATVEREGSGMTRFSGRIGCTMGFAVRSGLGGDVISIISTSGGCDSIIVPNSPSSNTTAEQYPSAEENASTVPS